MTLRKVSSRVRSTERHAAFANDHELGVMLSIVISESAKRMGVTTRFFLAQLVARVEQEASSDDRA